MSSGVFVIRKDGSLQEMSQADFNSEDTLQELLAQYPNLLAGSLIDEENPRIWILISREFGVPDQKSSSGRWSVDHLFLDQDGIPTLVEVKRGSNTQIRRDVVGQMLEYAANAVSYWSVKEIRSIFESSYIERGKDPELVWMEIFEVDEEYEYEEYWQKVETNLETGKIRMLFIADEIPIELKQIVEFLNEQMSPAEVLALEIKQYTGVDQTTLIPRIYGQSSKIQAKKSIKSPKRGWNDKLNWTTPEVRELAISLKTKLENDYKDVVSRESGSRYVFGRGGAGQKNRFAVITVQKKRLSLRIRFDPAYSSDPKGLLKDQVYDWFMKGKGEEREFHIDSINQLDEAIPLISQSYDLSS